MRVTEWTSTYRTPFGPKLEGSYVYHITIWSNKLIIKVRGIPNQAIGRIDNEVDPYWSMAYLRTEALEYCTCMEYQKPTLGLPVWMYEL